MRELDEMKAYVGFGPADEARLQRLWTVVEPRRRELVDQFYEPILRTPAARVVLAEEAQVERLKVTLMQWLQEMLQGPHDDDYALRRRRIGLVHVSVQLPSRFMYTAMSVMREVLCKVSRESFPIDVAFDMCESIERITSIDLALMTGTYLEAHEAAAMSSLTTLIVLHLPVMVVLLDANGTITHANRSAERMLGVDQLEGRALASVIPPALGSAVDFDAVLGRAMRTRREISMPRVDVDIEGRLRSFRVDVVPLEHPMAAALVHVEELTEAVETEARLRQAESLAQLGTMSAAVAHELRNPLAGISGALQVIGRSLADDDRRKLIMEKVEGQVRRLNALVTDLLAFARPDPARAKDVQLREVVRAALDPVRGEFPAVKLTLEGDGTAFADPHLVQSIVLNLVQNAAQAMDGQGEVLVRLSAGEVLIADGGSGVPVDLRDKIFEPFFTTRTRGTGLGLAISRKAARAMNGDLQLLATGPRSGATFRLLVPSRP